MGNFDIAKIGAACGYEFDGVGAKFAESGDGIGESGDAAGGSERRGGGVFAAAVGAVAEETFFAAVAVGGREWGGALRDGGEHAALRGDDVLCTFQNGPAIGRRFQPGLIFADARHGVKEIVARAL